jgi:hypothetical protein
MRVTRMGLCLLALLAMSAVIAATVSAAEPPDYGRCLKVAVAKSGVWAKNCTTTSGTTAKEYEWYPGFEGAKPIVKAGYTTKLKATTTLTLETVTGAKVVCTGEKGEGFIGNYDYSQVSSMTLTGCSSEGFACQGESQPAGTIVSATAFDDFIGWSSKPLKKVSALLYYPSWELACSGGTLAGYSKIYIYLGAIVPLKSGKMVKKETVKYAATGGKQKPEEAETWGAYHLEAQYYNLAEEFVGTEQIGLTAGIIQVNEEKIEINPVI